MEAIKERRNSFKFRWQVLLLLCISLLLYTSTFNHGFTWDDQLVLTQNKTTLKGIDGLKDIWTNNAYLESREIYRPVPQSVHAIISDFFPNSPKTHHSLNVLLYIFSCISFLILLRRIFKKTNDILLFLGAVLFCLLPVHVEVVANIKSMDELLACIFVIWSFYFLLKHEKAHTILAVLFLILACLSKISAITVVPLAILIPLQGKIIQVVEKIKNFLFASYLPAFISIILIAFVLYNGLSGNSIIFYTLTPLMISLVFILWIRSRILRFVLFFLALGGLSYYGRWEFGLLGFIPFFYLDLQNEKVKWQELAFKVLIFNLITFLLDYNSWLTAILIFAFFSLIYFNYKKKLVAEERMKLILLSGIVAFVIISIINLEIKISLLGILMVTIIFTLIKKKTLLKASIFLLLAIPISEFLSFKEFYTPKSSIIVTEKIVESANESNAINPYHNILVLSDLNTQKAATICRIQLIYLQKLIFPTALVHQYGTWQIKMASWKDWDVYLSILIHVLLLWLAYYFYRQKYYITMWGILWYFSTISIYTNIIRLMPDSLAERFLFLPSIGFSIALVSGLYFLIQKFQKDEKKSILTLALVLLPLFSYYAYKTIDRSKDWKDNYTLAANTLPYAENNAAINAQYALELNNLVKAGQIQNVDSAEALVVAHYKKAIELFPDFYGPQADLANYYILKSQPELAFPYLKEAARLKPEEWIHHYFLGLIYYERKEYALGIENFSALIQDSILQANPIKFPELLEAYEFKARCLHNIGKDEEAYNTLIKAVEVFNQRSTYVLLSNLYRMTGKIPLAIETFERLLLITPGDQELINTIELLKQGKIL